MSKMKDIWKQMEKNYNLDGMIPNKTIETITTGSYLLDDIMGNGIPKGRIIQYAGRESCGKTLLSLIAIKEWQKLNPENWSIYIDAEFAFDSTWAQKLGVDLERLYLVKENDAAKIFNMLCGTPNKEFGKPKSKLGFLDAELQSPSGLGIIVLDSIASLQPPISIVKQTEANNIAPLGRFLPNALSKLIPLLAQTGVVFIGINQVRIDVGKLFGDPTSTPGGKALKHACSVMVHFLLGESKKHFILDDAGEISGHILGARIDKNRVAPPRRSCEFKVDYFKGVIDRHIEIGDLAIRYGVIEKPTTTSYIYGDKKWVGKDNFYEGILKENLMYELLPKIKEAKLNGPVITESIDENLNDGEENE